MFQPENLAYGKPATQSGVYSVYEPYLAIDGDLNQSSTGFGCAISRPYKDYHAWWSLDLSDNKSDVMAVVKSVKIYFAMDCCGGMYLLCYS